MTIAGCFTEGVGGLRASREPVRRALSVIPACRWDNMTVSSSGTMLRDPARCLHVECWHTVYGAFIDVTIVHEARGCELTEGLS